MRLELTAKSIYLGITAIAIAFIVLPLGVIVWTSFFANKILTFPPSGYTLSWYSRAWAMEDFRGGFITSVEVASVAAFVSLLLGVPASLALTKRRFAGRDVVQTILLSPMIVPGVVGGAALFISYLEIEILFDYKIAGTLPGLLIAHALITLPWTIRLTSAALVGMNRSCEEAAASLGAPPLAVFRRVTLPLLRPAIVASGLFSFIVSFIDLEKSIYLVGPGRTTLQIALVNYLEWNLDSTVAAVATVQMAIVAAVMLISDSFVRISRFVS